MNKYWLICIFLLLDELPTIAQRPINIDSLRKVYVKLEQNKANIANDSAKIITMVEIVIYHDRNQDSSDFYSNKLMQLAQKSKWKKGLFIALINKSYSLPLNNFQERLKYTEKALKQANSQKDSNQISESYGNFGSIYDQKGNIQLALKYYLKAFNFSKNPTFRANTSILIGNTYDNLNKDKIALLYYDQAIKICKLNNLELFEAFAMRGIAAVYIDIPGKEKEALALINKTIIIFKKLKRPMFLASSQADIGRALVKNKKFAEALPYLQLGWNAQQKYNWPYSLDEFNLDKNLHTVYKNVGDHKSALFHLEKYNEDLDSAMHDELKAKYDVIKIGEDKREQQVQINNQKLKIKQQTNTILWAGLTLMAILAGVMIGYNKKLRDKNHALNEKNEIIRSATEKIQAAEISALRSQMNPHFIFNCLNSIQLFTAQNKSETASKYLTKFARLIRLVLDNSKADKIALSAEIETLQLYVDMEAMRFGDKIKPKIIIDSEIDTTYLQIPPLLIQPFVENAIWHGLMHKEAGGNIYIEFAQNENLLKVTITDDGIGREKAQEFNSKSALKNKSYGMKITAQRIELIKQLYKTEAKVQIIDLKNSTGEPSGTKVELEIPI